MAYSSRTVNDSTSSATALLVAPASDFRDVYVLGVALNSSTATITNLAAMGYTAVSGSPGVLTLGGQSLHVAYKVCAGDESGTQTFNLSETVGYSGFLACFTGRDPQNPLDNQQKTEDNTSRAFPFTLSLTGFTPNTDNCDTLLIWGADNLTSGSVSSGATSGGFVERADNSNTTDANIVLSTVPQTTRTATGSVTVNAANTGGGNAAYFGFLLSLKQAPVATVVPVGTTQRNRRTSGRYM